MEAEKRDSDKNNESERSDKTDKTAEREEIRLVCKGTRYYARIQAIRCAQRRNCEEIDSTE